MARLRDDEIYERILLQGSKAGLEPSPSTKDIDAIMRTMMSPSMDIGSRPHMGKNAPLNAPNGTSTGPAIVNGPWNNFGIQTAFERRGSVASSTAGMNSTTTVGKRSRNGTSRNV